MPVDKTWLLLTEVYAIAALVSLVAVVAACTILVLKVRRTVKQMKARVKAVGDRQRSTATSVKRAGDRITLRAERSAEVVKATAQRILGALKTIGT